MSKINKKHAKQIPVNQTLICYCIKCSLLQERIYDELNLFKSHFNSEQDNRCLNTGKYKENNTSTMGVGFYVMSPK